MKQWWLRAQYNKLSLPHSQASPRPTVQPVIGQRRARTLSLKRLKIGVCLARDAPTSHWGPRPWGEGLLSLISSPAMPASKNDFTFLFFFQGTQNSSLGRSSSASDKILFCVTFCFVIFASAGINININTISISIISIRYAYIYKALEEMAGKVLIPGKAWNWQPGLSLHFFFSSPLL